MHPPSDRLQGRFRYTGATSLYAGGVPVSLAGPGRRRRHSRIVTATRVQPAASHTLEIGRTAVERLAALASLRFGHYPTPVEEMPRLRAALGGGPRLLVKRDDSIPFACGGNKVRKIEMLAARAVADGADTLISTGSVQSNHARVVAAVASRLGMRCVLVLNGQAPGATATGNTRLMLLFGARIEYVQNRAARGARMLEIAEELQRHGRRPFILPLGASTALGALGFVRAMEELLGQVSAPDVILVASSSGGTQAGLVSGCHAFGLRTEVVGISADDPAAEIAGVVHTLRVESGAMLGLDHPGAADRACVVVDDRFVGEGYGIPTPASIEAARLAAATESLVLDPVYTAKAMAALIDYVRSGRYSPEQTVLFWHTGGVPGFFA